MRSIQGHVCVHGDDVLRIGYPTTSCKGSVHGDLTGLELNRPASPCPIGGWGPDTGAVIASCHGEDPTRRVIPSAGLLIAGVTGILRNPNEPDAALRLVSSRERLKVYELPVSITCAGAGR